MLLDYKNVNIYQDSQLVLNDVNFTVNEGEFIYITGKVGSGKSTLFKSIYGEIPVKEGSAMVLDNDIVKLKQKNLPELRRKLGIIFQDFQLLSDRTVEANLRFVLKATGWKDKKEIDQRIKEVLELVGMSTKGYKKPYELSGGEQQRISIARAILNNPKLILADEPTGNLDVETSNNITELLQNISKSGSAVIMITHNMNLLSRFPGKVFRCVDHHFSEVTAPVFDLSAIDDENEELAISSVAEGNGSFKEVSEEAPINAEPTVESLKVEEKPLYEDTPRTAPVMKAPENTESSLKPLEDMDDFIPSDITAINDIIRQHENKDEANNEVID